MTLQPIAQHEPRPSFEPFNVKADNERFPSRYSWDEATPDPTLRQRFARFPWKTFCTIASLPLALAPIVLLASLAEIASTGYIQNRDCYPNGLWSEATGATWRIMDSSYFFTPNLSFGSMTFTAAKVIDISWDLLIGRGGQMLLAWVNYRVFNEWILYHMEMHLTSYKMYTAVAFQTTSLSTLGVLAKEWLAFGENNWRRFFRWLTLLCMMLSTLYVLSFPTLMGALTGYITTYEAYIEDTSSNLIKFSEFSPVKWIVWDAERVVGNYTKPLVVSQDDSSLSKDLENYVNTFVDWDSYQAIAEPPMWGINFSEHTTSAPSPADLFSFSFNRSSTFTIDGAQHELASPTLNITWFGDGRYHYSNRLSYLYYAYDGRQSDPLYVEWLLNNGSCKPSDTYQWGFSYIFLFMVSIFNFVWSCIMIGMWYDTSRASRMYKSGRRPGLLKSILDVSEAMKEELGGSADKLEEEELRSALTDSGGALVVSKSDMKVARRETDTGIRQRSWRRNLTKGSTF